MWSTRGPSGTFERDVRAGNMSRCEQGGDPLHHGSRRNATVEELVEQSLPRLQEFLRNGVTTSNRVDMDWMSTETRCSMPSRSWTNSLPNSGSDLLGAHTLPPEFHGNRGTWRWSNGKCPKLRKRAWQRSVMCFVSTAFSVRDARGILTRANELGMGIKLHMNGSPITAELPWEQKWAPPPSTTWNFFRKGCGSARKSGTVAAILPGATLFLGMTQWACTHTVGSGIPLLSPPTTIQEFPHDESPTNDEFGVHPDGNTVDEALAGATTVAARAVEQSEHAGALSIGIPATLCVLTPSSAAEMVYFWGGNQVSRVMVEGKWVIE